MSNSSSIAQDQIDYGTNVEMEHALVISQHLKDGTTTEDVARMIAINHLEKDPDYYRKLSRLQNEGATGGEVIGKRHSECDDVSCGEQYNVGGSTQVVELEGGEGVLKVSAMDDEEEYTVKGTPRQIASCLNEMHGGRNFRSDGTPCEIEPTDKMHDGGVTTNPSAGIAMITHGMLLVCHPTNAQEFHSYTIPKGQYEDGETSKDTALRELKEEVGIDLPPRYLENAQIHTITTKTGRQVDYYIVHIDDLSKIDLLDYEIPRSHLQLEEVDWAGFVPFEEARNLMMPSHASVLENSMASYHSGGEINLSEIPTESLMVKDGAGDLKIYLTGARKELVYHSDCPINAKELVKRFEQENQPYEFTVNGEPYTLHEVKNMADGGEVRINLEYVDPEGIDWAKDRLIEDKIEAILKDQGIKCRRGGCNSGSGIDLQSGERDIGFVVPAKHSDKAVKAIKKELESLMIKRKDIKVSSNKYGHGGMTQKACDNYKFNTGGQVPMVGDEYMFMGEEVRVLKTRGKEIQVAVLDENGNPVKKKSFDINEFTRNATKFPKATSSTYSGFSAETIIEQLGGNRFIVMTGAKNFVKNDKEKWLSFRIGRNKSKANHIRISLLPNDTYRVEFGRIHGANFRVLDTYDDVYGEDLQKIFTSYTGMYTQLADGGKVNKFCPEGTEIQTLIFSKDWFSKPEAKDWAKRNKFKYGKVDEKEDTFRLRQQDPEDFEDDKFRTIELRDGLKAVIGCPL